MAPIKVMKTFSTKTLLRDRLHRSKGAAPPQEASDVETSGEESGQEMTAAVNQEGNASTQKPVDTDTTQKEKQSDCDSPLGQTWGNALGAMKDRAFLAKSNMKDKASKGLEKVQPNFHLVKSTATFAATKGRECMQPALSKGSVGWNRFKTRISSASTVISNHSSNDTITLSSVHPSILHTRFLLTYKPFQRVSEDTHSSGTRCLHNPFLLGTILSFSGDIQVLNRMSAVNRACHTFIRSEKRLMRFCVRYGSISDHIRATFWEDSLETESLRANSEISFATYIEMAESKLDHNDAIRTDVQRISKDNNSQLISLLLALSSRLPTVGYVQGMDYIAAHVLNQIKTSDTASPTELERAFWLLVALFEIADLKGLFTNALEALQLKSYQVQRIVERISPPLMQSLEKVSLDLVLVGWCQTLFLYVESMPKATLDRIWDIFVYEKSFKVITRTCCALLLLAETQEDVVGALSLKNNATALLAEKQLMDKALATKVTRSMLLKLHKPRRFGDRYRKKF